MKIIKKQRSTAQKRFARGIAEERNAAKHLQAIDGKVGKPWTGIVTSTGRIGDIHRFQADCLSQHYVGEVKHVSRRRDKKDWGHRVSSDEMKKLVTAERTFNKFLVYILHLAGYPTLHGITKERHAWLLACERAVTNSGQTLKARRDCEGRITDLELEKLEGKKIRR